MNKMFSAPQQLKLTEPVFDFIDAMIQLIFVYRIYKKKQYGIQIGLCGDVLDNYIRQLFDDYPVYGFICNIAEDLLDLSERPNIAPLSGLERPQTIANTFLLEKKYKYNDHQLMLFGLFEWFKGIDHIYCKREEKIAMQNAIIVANSLSNCIGCNRIPSNKCTFCMQIVYCGNAKCLRVEHNCCHATH